MRNMASALLTKTAKRKRVSVPFEDGELTFVEPNGRTAITMLAGMAEDFDAENITEGKNYEAACIMIQLTWVDENDENVLGKEDYQEFLDELTLGTFTLLSDGAVKVCEDFLGTDSEEETG